MLAHQLQSTLPPRAQLRSAMARLKTGLAACTATSASTQELELVLDDRRRSLGELRCATLAHQQQVDTLTAQVREEEAERLAEVASQCQASVGAALAPSPITASAEQMTLEQLAAAFYARLPAASGSGFKQWLEVQPPLANLQAPAAGVAAPSAAAPLAAGSAAAPSLTAQLLGQRQRSAALAKPLAAPPSPAAQAAAAQLALADQTGTLATPIEVDAEEEQQHFDWSTAGLALPVDSGPAAAQRGPSVLAFGKVTPTSRSSRGDPYASSSALATAAASVQAAELLLASVPESSEEAASPMSPGGVAVKLEDASA